MDIVSRAAARHHKIVAQGHAPLVLGIDPGLDGGLAWLAADSGRVRSLLSVPSVGSGRKRELNRDGLVFQLRMWDWCTSFAVVEHNSTRPGNAANSVWKFARLTGQIEGQLDALGIPIVQAVPSVWKPLMGVTADKRSSCGMAAKLWPAYRSSFYGPRGGLVDGVAEAALLAMFGVRRYVPTIRQTINKEEMINADSK